TQGIGLEESFIESVFLSSKESGDPAVADHLRDSCSYHLHLMQTAGLVCVRASGEGWSDPQSRVFNLTWAGHDYLGDT
ncbi:DUF2513 domain-containing protein, partial [Pandoraea sputorum]|uniref:DUF2513 domain-containing protein n=1 Tax=Pandoraea sputorum TaxID=93222 RepID=UPI00355883BB